MANISINDLRPADLAELKGSAKVSSSSSYQLTYAELTQVKGGFAGNGWALSLIDWALRDLERRREWS